MKKIIGICENKDEGVVIGLVITEPYSSIAFDCLKKMGFVIYKDNNQITILKSSVFQEDLINQFSINCALDTDYFDFFACHQDQLNSMLEIIEKN